MFKTVLALLFALAAYPQAVTMSGPTAVPVGSPVTIIVSLVSGTGPAGLQWDTQGLPTGATVTSLVPGKVANCSTTLARCILIGFDSAAPTTASNSTAIADGPVATIKFPQPSTAPSISLHNTLGATTAGQALVVAAPTVAFTVPIQSTCDINGDGKIDSSDISLILQQAITSTTGTPTLLDVIRVILAVNGGACLR